MQYLACEKSKDGVLLAARILMTALFITSGWGKLTGFAGTMQYMASVGAPLPQVAAGIAVIMEFGVGILLLVGFFTRPLALLLALFTLGTALIGHHFWNMTGAEHAMNMVQFYKNMSIIGGLLALHVAGPGKYSIDRR